MNTAPFCAWHIAEAIRKRFKTFVEESLPVKGHYAGD